MSEEIKGVEIQERPSDTGTAGLTSALQIVETTQSFATQFDTTQYANLYPILEEERGEQQENIEYFRDTIGRLMKKHKRTLDELAKI
jgi:hypothetical protein